MTLEEMKNRLRAAYPGGEIEVYDLTGGQDHWEVSITSPLFQGMTRIQQHQHVMSQFGSELKSGEVHALSIKTQIIDDTNSDYKVDQGATEGDAEACSLQAAQGDRPSNDGIRSNRNWYESKINATKGSEENALRPTAVGRTSR